MTSGRRWIITRALNLFIFNQLSASVTTPCLNKCKKRLSKHPNRYKRTDNKLANGNVTIKSNYILILFVLPGHHFLITMVTHCDTDHSNIFIFVSLLIILFSLSEI